MAGGTEGQSYWWAQVIYRPGVVVASLSKFLGWDITIGAREGMLNHPGNRNDARSGSSNHI
jgi:hypothetical protein